MAGWLRGKVKEVLSGDSVVIVANVKSDLPPPEKRLTLSSLVAPKLGKRDGSTRDESFAWDSREWLRKKLVGQPCVFKVDYVVEAIGNKEFGSIFLEANGQKENIALSVVSNGWAKVRETGSQQSPYIEDLKRAQEAAQGAGVGLWNKDPAALATAVRPMPDLDFNAMSFLSSIGKGKPIKGVVDAVLNGSTLRLTLPENDFLPVTVALAGVQAPSMGKRPAVVAAPAEGEAPAADAAPQPEPFAREAKWFSESRVLNQEVRVVLEGVDKYNNLFGSVVYTDADGKFPSLAEQLATAGLAKCVEWSLSMMTNGAMRLRSIEREAKQARKAMWANYVPQNTGQTKLSDTFVGKVVEIASGDTLIIKDVNAGVERRVQLSSIRAPRPAMRERPSEPHGNDAREFLRKKLIGKEVTVKMEYNRKIQPMPGAEAAPAGEERVLSFGNVELNDKTTDDRNAAEMAVARGYASVIRHRSDEERSSVYERLLELEEMAKSAKRGIHSSKEVSTQRVNDVSLPGNAARAKQYLPFFQRAGKLPATVEWVLSAHRLKLYVPKEGVSIAFAPSGIKTPARAQPASKDGRPAVAGEPYGPEAFAFTREHFMQREVEVEIEGVDKGGTFLGTLTLTSGPKPVNLGVTLLRSGLARLQPFFHDDAKGAREMIAAQDAAKQARLKIWENWSPEDDAVPDEDGEANGAAANGASTSTGAGERMSVTVTEVVDGTEFFIQDAAEPRVRWLEEQLAQLGLTDGPAATGLVQGNLCAGKFTVDNNWYRAYIEKVHPSEPRYEVYFIDFGNREKLPSDRVRPMEAALSAVPAQAKPAGLAYLKVPDLDSEFGMDAAEHLSQLVGGGKKLQATVVGRERPTAGPKEKNPRKSQGKLLVNLQVEGAELTVSQEMLSAGMARLPKLHKVRDAAAKAAISALMDYEEAARKAHRGMWEYGDPGDSEDEQDAMFTAGRGRGGKR